MASMFSAIDVKRLVEAADLPNFEDINDILPLLTAKNRWKALKQSNLKEEREIAAAIEIQRIWRGYRTRKILFAILCPSSATISYLSSNSSSPTCQDIRASLNSSPVSYRVQSSVSKGLSRIRSSYHTYTENILNKEKNEQKLLSFQGFAAWTIQCWWRERRECLRLAKINDEAEDAKSNRKGLSDFDAAVIIQKAWRKHIDIQVFQYYKQLINFHNKGDPQYMLKCINPKEADLLDAAAGIHIRFRMGGIKFPPNIYYKIFTHINVADVGSFSPRNYVDASTKHLPAKLIHNRGFDLSESETEDWYERYENNGWRLVSDRVMKYLNQDPVVYETSKTKMTFNHEKLVRRQDIALKKKRKKINWMKKMYASGMLKTNTDKDGHVNELVEAAAKGMMMVANETGGEMVEDWEVDELLEWTSGLNFDNYLQDWQQCGTTAIQTDIKGDLPRKDAVAAMVEENT